MNRSGVFFRWTAARPVALLLTIVALAVGVSACGSSTSTGAGSSTGAKGSSSVKKEASGLAKDVELTVTNEPSTGGALYVSVCDATPQSPAYGDCPQFNHYALSEGKSAYRTHEAVAGYVIDGADNGFYFYAKNPDVGEPYIQLWKYDSELFGKNLYNDSRPYTKYKLSEGETVPTPGGNYIYLGQRKIELHRGDDTSVKVMQIKVLQ